MKLNATAAIANSDTYAQKLQEANTQVELLNELGKYLSLIHICSAFIIF